MVLFHAHKGHYKLKVTKYKFKLNVVPFIQIESCQKHLK